MAGERGTKSVERRGHGDILPLGPGPGAELSLNSARDATQDCAAPVAFVTDGQTQVHLATKHLGDAFRADDIAAFKRLLEERNIPYSDYASGR